MYRNLLSVILILLISRPLSAQNVLFDTLSVSFWNLENLFDTNDDPKINDQEFLPESEKQWNAEKLKKKLLNLSAVIRSMNYGQGPDILGVCEVENAAVLNRLITDNLIDLKLKIAHHDSPDERGIDVALLYKSTKFKLIKQIDVKITLPGGDLTRDILVVILELKVKPTERFGVVINHWPSRRGGEKESEENRIIAGETAANKIAELQKSEGIDNIIVMGDFNDEPMNNSLTQGLKAKPITCDSLINISKGEIQDFLFNLAYESKQRGEGSYKYRDNWNMLDQIILSKNLLLSSNFNYVCNSFEVFKPYFMIQKEGRYSGTALPTFGGKTYLGGYSDHFPVTLLIAVRK